MALNDKHIAELQRIYKARFGKEISREEALAQGLKLLRMVELVYKPMTEVEYRQLEARRQETGDTSLIRGIFGAKMGTPAIISRKREITRV